MSRRARSRALALVAAVIVVVAGTTPAPAGVLGPESAASTQTQPTQTQPTQTQPTQTQPSMTLVARSRWAAAEGRIALDFTVAGPAEPTLVQLRVHDAVDSVEDLERSLEEDTGRILHRTVELPVGFISAQPDGTRRLEVAVSETRSDPATVRLPEPGVYPVSITMQDSAGNELDTIRTPVVRLGSEDEPLAGPDLQLVLDVAAPPSIGVEGRRELGDDELDRLARLAAVLDDGGTTEPPGLTVAASPDTVDALTASAAPEAARVLDALAADAGDRTSIGLPYVPLDASAMTNAGMGDLVGPVVEVGRAVLADRGGPELDTTTWEATGGIDPAGAATLAALGIRHVLVDAATPDGSESPAAERSLVDAGPFAVPEIAPLEAVVVDTATSAALTARAVDRIDAGHIALAELVVRDAGAATTVVVRTDDVPEGSVLEALLPLVADAASPVPVGPVRPKAMGRDGNAPAAATPPPPAPADGTLTAELTTIAPRVRALAAAVDTFAGMVGSESARADELRLQIATSLATGIDAGDRTALLDAVDAEVQGGFEGVVLAGQTDLNLTARSGTLPITIRNDNEFPVRVVLRIRSDRLTFREGDRFEQVVDDVARIDVPVDARATGSVPTFVEILTPDEELVLDSRRLDVRSTAVSGVGLLLSAGALVVLVIWWARTWRRNRRDPAGDAR
jgi:hypothetical protein